MVKFRAFALLAALVTSPAFPADTTPNDQSLVMGRIDADHDGTISLDEAKKAASAKFDALDTDHEATLDKSELTGIVASKTVEKADRDHDATLDKAEYTALVVTYFNQADTDHDGTLEPRELDTAPGRALVALLAY